MIRVRDKAIAAIGLAAILFSGVLASYHDAWGDFYEMTFLSNTTAAALLLAGGIKMLVTGRDIPQVLYFDASVLLVFIIGICAIYAPTVCLGGAGITLHLINPLLMLTFFAVFCDARAIKLRSVFTALIVPSLYFLFMITYGRVTGGYVYPYFDPNRYGAVELIMIGTLAAAALAALAVGIAVSNGAMRTLYEQKSRRAANVENGSAGE